MSTKKAEEMIDVKPIAVGFERDDKFVKELNLARLEVIATRMAPAFLFKVDFSNPKDYDTVADHAFEQARAIMRKSDALYAEAKKKDDEAAKAKEAAK